jgi:hypothetical protein
LQIVPDGEPRVTAAAAAATASTSSTGHAESKATFDATAVSDEYLKPQDKN